MKPPALPLFERDLRFAPTSLVGETFGSDPFGSELKAELVVDTSQGRWEDHSKPSSRVAAGYSGEGEKTGP
jgi:hypothetical protein